VLLLAILGLAAEVGRGYIGSGDRGSGEPAAG
jgi:hypothetical protein